MRSISVAAALFVAAGCAGMARDPGIEAHRLLAQLAAEGHFQGAVVLGQGGRVTYEGAFGFADVERRIPFTPDTRSDGGSIAKTFTAAAVLLLAHEGRIDLEAPVARYVAGYPHGTTRVRHLIAHSAALPGHDWFDQVLGEGKPRTNADQVALVRERAEPPAFAPGTRFEYDNAAYDTAAMVIEAASGQRYEDFLRARFLRPLGIEAFVRPSRLADFPGERTRGYRRVAGALQPYDAVEGEGFHGSGNLYVSARDLHRWAAAWAAQRALPAPAHRRALEPARLDGGVATGLSWASWYCTHDGERGYYRGDHNGFHVFAYWGAHGATVAFVSNGGIPNALKPRLARALVAIAEGRTPEPVRMPEVSAGTMVGRWRSPLQPELVVSEDHRLAVGGVEYRAFPAGRGVRYVPGLDATLHLEKTAAGDTLVSTSACRESRAERSP